MKNLFIPLLILSFFVACMPDEPGPRMVPEYCDYKNSVTAPPGFEITQTSNLSQQGSFLQLQFLDESLGYILGSKQIGGYSSLLKTEDGGALWQDMMLDILRQPTSMHFVNDTVGFITVHDTRGCPGNCENRCVVLKTTDGGNSWEEIVYDGLKGILYHVQPDDAGNLYASLFLDSNTQLLKSTDQGDSWQLINDSPEMNFSRVTFSFMLKENIIYASGVEGTLLKLDTDGNVLGTFTHGQGKIWDLEVIDEQNLILAGDRLVKTSDGGTNWEVLAEENSRLLSFSSGQEGFILLEKKQCAGDVYQVEDAIAYTEDGGKTWTESEVTTNLKLEYANTQPGPEGSVLILMKGQLWELREL